MQHARATFESNADFKLQAAMGCSKAVRRVKCNSLKPNALLSAALFEYHTIAKLSMIVIENITKKYQDG